MILNVWIRDHKLVYHHATSQNDQFPNISIAFLTVMLLHIAHVPINLQWRVSPTPDLLLG